MTQETTKKLLPIIQAFAEGKQIQTLIGGCWQDVGEIQCSIDASDLRIKPEPREWWGMVRDGTFLSYNSRESAEKSKAIVGSDEIIKVREVL